MNKIIYILSFLLFLIACETKKATKEIEITTKVPANFQMYKTSEMAVLMRKLYSSNKKIKKQIINNDEIGDFNEAFLKIHTATLTDSTAFDESYATYANHFIKTQKELFAVPKEERKEQFNAVLDACISCHKDRCTGPIPKIERLRIR